MAADMLDGGIQLSSVSSSLNPGVADLLQTLANVNSPVLNSQSVVSALESAPASDIVQLSAEATQLQGIDTLFGISSTPTSNMSSELAALEASATGSTTGTSTSSVLSNASPADQAANAQAALQAELTQGLFGTGTNNSLSGTLFNTIA